MPGDVVVIVPWRPGCPYREAAWDWIRLKYEALDLEVIMAECPPGPWVKANAVMPAIAATHAEIVVIADADAWCDGLEDAIDEVRRGAPWAVPHRRVKRLNARSTARVLAGEPPDRLQLEEPSYLGCPAGGLLVLPTKTALDIPLDPRFVGWGAEDRAWGWALTLLAGHPWRGRINLTHLWHPPQDRVDRNHGSPDSEALRRRYIAAEHRPDEMRALIEEIPPWKTSPP